MTLRRDVLRMLDVAALVAVILLAGCGRRAAETPVGPQPPVRPVAPQVTEKDLGIPFFPGAVVSESKRGSAGDLSVVLETSRTADDVAGFYFKQCNWPKKTVKADNAKIIAFSYKGAGVRWEITITEDFESGKTMINLFKGAAAKP